MIEHFTTLNLNHLNGRESIAWTIVCVCVRETNSLFTDRPTDQPNKSTQRLNLKYCNQHRQRNTLYIINFVSQHNLSEEEKRKYSVRTSSLFIIIECIQQCDWHRTEHIRISSVLRTDNDDHDGDDDNEEKRWKAMPATTYGKRKRLGQCGYCFFHRFSVCSINWRRQLVSTFFVPTFAACSEHDALFRWHFRFIANVTNEKRDISLSVLFATKNKKKLKFCVNSAKNNSKCEQLSW